MLAACCLLLVACCLLLVSGCLLLVARCSLLVACCLLHVALCFVACCLLIVTCCLLLVACCSLLVARCPLLVACCVLRAACCLLLAACCLFGSQRPRPHCFFRNSRCESVIPPARIHFQEKPGRNGWGKCGRKLKMERDIRCPFPISIHCFVCSTHCVPIREALACVKHMRLRPSSDWSCKEYCWCRG